MQELLKLILSFFSKPAQPETPTPVKPPTEIPKKETKVEINWSDPKAKVSKYFTVKEVLFLPSWGCYHTPSEEEKANVLKMAEVMDKVREFVGKPIGVHCWMRPNKANCTVDPAKVQWSSNTTTRKMQEAALAVLDYNAFIGSTAKRSPHISGKAVDWDCNENCDDTRTKLMSKLDEFNMCMEDVPGGNWIHLDIYEPAIHGGKRFFKP